MTGANRIYNCAITGASGYVGSRISAFLRGNGWLVYELSRSNPNPKNNRFVIDYSLDRDISSTALRGVDVLIHCAYDFRLLRWERIVDVNVEGSVRLFQTATKAGVKKIIFISTMSAFEGCKSLYGKAKMEIEKEAFRIGAAVIRPGLVFGREAGGLITSLCRMVCAAKVVPLIGTGRQVLHLVHEQDLCRLIYRIAVGETTNISTPIMAAAEAGKTLKQIMCTIAEIKQREIIFFPVPWVLIWIGLKFTEAAGLRVGFRSDSLISLLNQDRNPDFELTRQAGIDFREFDLRSLA